MNAQMAPGRLAEIRKEAYADGIVWMGRGAVRELLDHIAQLEARIVEVDPFARTWRDFAAGWAAARRVPTQDERETDYAERDAAAERWETALRNSKVITAKEEVKP